MQENQHRASLWWDPRSDCDLMFEHSILVQREPCTDILSVSSSPPSIVIMRAYHPLPGLSITDGPCLCAYFISFLLPPSPVNPTTVVFAPSCLTPTPRHHHPLISS